MNIGDYTNAFAKALVPLLPGGPAIAVLIEDPGFKEANKQIAKALEPVTQPVLEVFNNGLEAGKKQLGISDYKELYPLLADTLKQAQEQEAKNKELALVDSKQIESQRITQKELRQIVEETRREQARQDQVEAQRQADQALADMRRIQREFEQRQQAEVNAVRAAEANRTEIYKQKEDQHHCSAKYERNEYLMKLARRYGIYLEAGNASLSTGEVFQKILARAKHNIIGLKAFAKENPGLGLDRAVIQLARNSIQTTVKEFLGNDPSFGNTYMDNAKLSPGGISNILA